MDVRLIAGAIPVFFLLIALEFALNRARGDGMYTFHDAIACLSCGVGQQMWMVLFRTLQVAFYALVYTRVHLLELSPRSAWTWVVAVLGVDFCYYLYHRAGHRVNVLWAMHAVHHQSEEYNLAVALRQSWFNALTGWVFYLPPAPPEWLPRDLGGPVSIPEVDRHHQRKYGTTASRRMNVYVFVNFVLVVLGTIGVLVSQKSLTFPVVDNVGRMMNWLTESLPTATLSGAIALVLWTLVNLSGLIERRVWAPASEVLRLVLQGVVAVLFLPTPYVAGSVVICSALAAYGMWTLLLDARAAGGNAIVPS